MKNLLGLLGSYFMPVAAPNYTMARRESRSQNAKMRNLLLLMALTALAVPASADSSLLGRYRLAEGPDVAGELELTADGRFRYALAAGALDERAQGRWESTGGTICLHTEPKPVPPRFSKASSEGQTATLLVTWPDGSGIPGVDFRIGFDAGDPLEGYTQYYGWTMPDGDVRLPLWIELSVPMHGLRSPRFELDALDGGRIHIVLTPNDLGVVDFQGACLEPTDDGVVLHRKEGDMRFRRMVLPRAS